MGPHRFFSYDKRVNELWLEVVGKDYKMVNRLTRIFYKNKFFFYPVQAMDALKKVGFFTGLACFFSYLAQRVCPIKSDGSFETWVTRRFGKKLYRMFFKTYSEKLWGVKCTDLDDDFAAQRIKKLSMMEVALTALKLKKTAGHKTLVDKFAYPMGGTGEVYKRMAVAVTNAGGHIHTGKAVERVVVEDGCAKAVVLQGESTPIPFDEIISTMPFTDVIKQIPALPNEVKNVLPKLKYRNTIMVFLKVDGKDLFEDNWLYVHSEDLQMGRVTNFRNWIPELYGDSESTILALEYWCYDEDEFWHKSDAELIELASKEIKATGLTKHYEVSAGHVERIHRSYPTYHRGYKKDLKVVEDYASQITHLHCIGRYGAFKYNNQDHSLLMGVLTAENIAKGTKHNLWSVNTDYDNYQESTLITETGLEKS